MRKTRGALAPLLLVAVAACPDSKPGESTGSSTSSPSTTTGHESGTTAETITPSSTTGATTSTATSSNGPSSTTSGSTGSTSGAGTTTDGTTSPIDVTCTYPGSTSEGPLSPDLAPECACVDPGGVLLCAAPSCPTISGACAGGDFLDPVCHGQWMYNEAALECALTAARDGTLGTLRWHFSPNDGYSYRAGFLHIVAERRALRQDVDWFDYSGEVSDTQLWQLKDPQFFQGCLDLPDFCTRLICFFAAAEGNALSLCLPGFYERGF